jgi:excisionase family DNA binding protein
MNTPTVQPTAPHHTVVDTMGAAEYVGLHPRTLENWRSQGRGLRYLRVGRRIVYRIADLEAYLESRVVEPSR